MPPVPRTFFIFDLKYFISNLNFCREILFEMFKQSSDFLKVLYFSSYLLSEIGLV